MPESDFAVVEVEGQALTKWSDYEISSDLTSPVDTFELTVPMAGTLADRKELMRLLIPGRPVKVYVGRGAARSLQMTGLVTMRDVSADRNGTRMTIHGQDMGQHLVRSHSDPRLGVIASAARTIDVKADTFQFTRNPYGGYTDESNVFGAIGQPKGSKLRAPSKYDLSSVRVVDQIKIAAQGKSFPEVLRQLLDPWGIDVVTDGTAARDLLSGKAKKGERNRINQERARNLGIPLNSFSRDVESRARSAGKPLDDVLGVETTDNSRQRFANGMVSSDIERITIKEAKPAFGESIWDYIERQAKRFGLLAWMSPDGKLILSAPNYGSAPLFRIVRRLRENPDDPNTVIKARLREEVGDRVSHVMVYGRHGGRNPERSKYKATAVDPDLGIYRPEYVSDQEIRSDEEALRRARNIISFKRANAFEYDVTMPDHGQGNYLYSVDQMARVEDEVLGVSGDYYVVARTFLKTRGQNVSSLATVTRLRLAPIGIFAV